MTNLASPFILLAYPFRPFFLLVGIYGVASIAAWMGYLFGGIQLPSGWPVTNWHSHEMLFGLVSAATAGFLLTAICNWTGAKPLTGAALLALITTWVAGRVAMWTAALWPASLVAAIDMLFLSILAIYTFHVLILHGNRRNLILAGILVALAICNLMMHIGAITGHQIWMTLGQTTAFNLIAGMLIVIGGRITPLFTANWLRNYGRQPDDVKSSKIVEYLAFGSILLLILAELLRIKPWLIGSIAFSAAAVHLIRLAGWSGWKAKEEPLLWILHLGYLWIVIGFTLKGAASLDLIPPGAWLHALGVGAMGTLILGVMTRVSLGHTGRPLSLPKAGLFIYAAVTLSATVRVLAALQLIDYRWGLIISGTAWIMAFFIFVLTYWPILNRPRVDGRPG